MQSRPTAGILARLRAMLPGSKPAADTQAPQPVAADPVPAPTPVAAAEAPAKEA